MLTWPMMLPWNDVAARQCYYKTMLRWHTMSPWDDVTTRQCCCKAMLTWHTMQWRHETMLPRGNVDVTHDVAMKLSHVNVTSCQHHLVSSVSCKHQLVIVPALSPVNIMVDIVSSLSACQHYFFVLTLSCRGDILCNIAIALCCYTMSMSSVDLCQHCLKSPS